MMHVRIGVKLSDPIELNFETIKPSTNLTAKRQHLGFDDITVTPL
jgi:hypothetical protein